MPQSLNLLNLFSLSPAPWLLRAFAFLFFFSGTGFLPAQERRTTEVILSCLFSAPWLLRAFAFLFFFSGTGFLPAQERRTTEVILSCLFSAPWLLRAFALNVFFVIPFLFFSLFIHNS
jgi:hypothetical protein